MPRRLAAILAADIVGYSKAMAADEAGTLARLKAHRAELFEPAVAKHNGRIIKLMGDGTLVEFSSVVDAVECAIAIQSALAAVSDAMELRIGINLGDVIVDDDDVYGDGVNVAARLEVLAPQGGICVSDMVYQNIQTKLVAEFEDGGAQTLKNISKPVCTWRWLPDTANPQGLGTGPAHAKSTENQPERAAIAVLPLDNMSGDPDQEYFSDGISEDIITELSRFRELFVIARNSSFSYKGRSVKVQEIGRDLGVSYVVEGSVRKAGNRVRITVQLIEAASGNHVWAERYDRELQDIFDLQDEITQAIVALLPVRLHGDRIASVRHKASENLTAYDCYLHGRWLYDKSSGQNPKALDLLDKALEIDPGCAHAHAYIARAHAYSIYTVNPTGADPLAAAQQSTEQALAKGEGDPFIHATAGYVYIFSGSHELADRHSAKALLLNPNDIFAMLARGYVLAYLGEYDAGVAQLTQALRHDPHYPDYFHELLAEACYMQRNYEQAVDIYNRWQNPPLHMYVPLAVNYAQLGRMDEAKAAIAQFEDKRPDHADFTNYAVTHVRMCRRPEDADHWLEGYRKVGFAV
ncbi:MAG: tetratricopeptide repeat protein [Alphaproteobacteria bacterium]|nr:tetratricopeptide repeat protein [Alphaproteobacteria bacterium]